MDCGDDLLEGRAEAGDEDVQTIVWIGEHELIDGFAIGGCGVVIDLRIETPRDGCRLNVFWGEGWPWYVYLTRQEN